jgi:hypothetical protein
MPEAAIRPNFVNELLVWNVVERRVLAPDPIRRLALTALNPKNS